MMTRGSIVVAAFVFALLLGFSEWSAAQEKGEGPFSLLMSYKCEPANRAAFRAHMAGPGVRQFEAWKQGGAFKDYLILFSSFVNSRELDMLVRLDFAQYVDSEKWRVIERTYPGGLSQDALKLCSPDTAYLADLTWEGGPSASRDLSKAVYVYIPYHFMEKGTTKPEYKKYFETYVKPQNDGWLAANVLSWWGVYLNQHNTGAPWDSLFLYEYSNTLGLARRDLIKAEVRAKLQSNPVWKAVSDNKKDVRIEDQVIIMEPVLLPR
jgi:hypothetical protein